MGSADQINWVAYRYDPSTVGAVIFMALFISASTLHVYQVVRSRTWYFIPLIIGGLFEFIGYAGRLISSLQSPNWTLGPYIIQSILLLVAPALFAASIYMELGRIMQLVDGDNRSLIKRRWLTATFVTGDVICFFMQSGGGGIMAKGSVSSMKLGEKIILGGLGIQILFFGLFMFVAVHFEYSMRSNPTLASQSLTSWRKHIHALDVASICILVRSIFRVAEFSQGNDGYLISHEVFLFVFDALLMFTVIVVFNIIHPSEVNALLKGGKCFKHGIKAVELRSLRQQMEQPSLGHDKELYDHSPA